MKKTNRLIRLSLILILILNIQKNLHAQNEDNFNTDNNIHYSIYPLIGLEPINEIFNLNTSRLQTYKNKKIN